MYNYTVNNIDVNDDDDDDDDGDDDDNQTFLSHNLLRHFCSVGF